MKAASALLQEPHSFDVIFKSWFSNDLQMVVKSVSSDPRFGETTYRLTNIVRTMQDPALFQIPADYTVVERPGLSGK